MAVRLVVTITAAPGKGAELAQAMKARCEECMKEPGCEQFEIFQSALNPDKLALLELWSRSGGARRARQTQRHPPAVAGGPAARRRRARGLRIQPHAVATGIDGASHQLPEAPDSRRPIGGLGAALPGAFGSGSGAFRSRRLRARCPLAAPAGSRAFRRTRGSAPEAGLGFRRAAFAPALGRRRRFRLGRRRLAPDRPAHRRAVAAGRAAQHHLLASAAPRPSRDRRFRRGSSRRRPRAAATPRRPAAAAGRRCRPRRARPRRTGAGESAPRRRRRTGRSACPRRADRRRPPPDTVRARR